MQHRIVLSENYFPKYSWVHVAMSIMVAWRFLKQYRLRAQWSRAFSSGFYPWPGSTGPSHQDFHNTPWIFPQYYELWMVKDLNSSQSSTEKHCVWTDWQFSHKVWEKVVNHDPSLLAKTKPLVDAPFTLKLDNLTCYQLNC